MTSPIVGYRTWRVAGSLNDLTTLRLQSIVAPSLWPIDEPMRRQHYQELAENIQGYGYIHKNQDCICGVYAYKRPRFPADGFLVSGTVALWGDVETHVAGYRAQYAYPLRLFDAHCWRWVCRSRLTRLSSLNYTQCASCYGEDDIGVAAADMLAALSRTYALS